MERKEYLEKEIKTEKGKMKRLLWDWGNAMERFGWKEEELEKLQQLYQMKKQIWSGGETEKAKRELEKIEKEYREERGRLRIEMVEILREKAWIDGNIKKLTMDEQTFIQMRFEKEYGFEYIGMKMHLSRATLFRMQERVLKKLLLCRKNDESE